MSHPLTYTIHLGESIADHELYSHTSLCPTPSLTLYTWVRALLTMSSIATPPHLYYTLGESIADHELYSHTSLCPTPSLTLHTWVRALLTMSSIATPPCATPPHLYYTLGESIADHELYSHTSLCHTPTLILYIE